MGAEFSQLPRKLTEAEAFDDVMAEAEAGGFRSRLPHAVR